MGNVGRTEKLSQTSPAQAACARMRRKLCLCRHLSRGPMSPVALLRDSSASRQTAENAISAAIADLGAGHGSRVAPRLAAFAPSSDLGAPLQALIGRVLVGAGNYRAALPWLDSAIVAEPQMVDALASRASALLMLDEQEPALAAYERAFAAGLRDPVAFYNCGTLLVQLGNASAALTAFDRALALRPAYPAALRAAGRVLQSGGQLEGALHLFRLAVGCAPDDLDAVLDYRGPAAPPGAAYRSARHLRGRRPAPRQIRRCSGTIAASCSTISAAWTKRSSASMAR